MTGCGYARHIQNNKIITAEIQSVNSRYLDINCRCPKGYSRLEDKIKALIGRFCFRGKIDLFVTVENIPGAKELDLCLNDGYLKEYLTCLAALRDEYGLKDDITVCNVAQNRDIFLTATPEEKLDQLWDELQGALVPALESLSAMRRVEGTALCQDLKCKLNALQTDLDEITALAPGVLQAYEQKLTARVKELLGSADYDEGRLLTEVAIFADRVAIDEETTRLASHLMQFAQVLTKTDGAPAGRKLDFLLQEINREFNTIGSKCNDAHIAELVVDAKWEGEKLREQIQNIE